MGNSIAGSGRKRVKVMKINGETMKLRVPLRAGDVTKDHPGHVLLDAEAVKHFGIRAKPLEPQMDLKPKRLYFLVQIPMVTTTTHDHHNNNDHDHRISSRRVMSGINMSAKDRLECLMLSRRSVSDLASVRPSMSGSGDPTRAVPGPTRVTMRLPKSQVAKLVEESKDEAEVAEKIIGIYMRNNNVGDVGELREKNGRSFRRDGWKSGGAVAPENHHKAREKRVSFLPINEGEISLAVNALS